MTDAYLYLRTSADDRDKAGIPVQREACCAFAQAHGYAIVGEFIDDGISGTVLMENRPSGQQMRQALISNGVKVVVAYDGKRIGRTQPVFWEFIGTCRAKGVQVIDANGSDLTDAILGGVNGMLAEKDRQDTVARLAAGKKQWRSVRRVDGRHPYGEHPDHAYDDERAVVAEIVRLHSQGMTPGQISRQFIRDGRTTRYGKDFHPRQVARILERLARQA